ncbi:winged helix-turn-helix domain-containing protein [Methanophagales archaeon]|nr:MAG: winged helix-turn-helix domain-containing protein [Methanophagales archaeon]
MDGIEPNWKGNPGTIPSEEELEQLRNAVKKSPREGGFKNGRWTGRLVADFVYERFGKEISIRTAIRYLHRLGFKLKRARKKFKKADPEEQKRFAKDLQELEKNRSPRSVTVYVDEVRYGVMPHSGVFGLRLVLR